MTEPTSTSSANEEPEFEHLTPATLDFERVHRVSERVELEGVRLLECHAELNGSLQDFDADWALRAYVGFDTHSNGWSDDETLRFQARGSFLAMFRPDYDARTKDEPPSLDEENQPALWLQAVLELDYEVLDREGLTDEDLEHFAFVNGTFHAWPYWREFAQSMTSRMGIVPPLTVSAFKVPKVEPDAETE